MNDIVFVCVCVTQIDVWKFVVTCLLCSVAAIQDDELIKSIFEISVAHQVGWLVLVVLAVFILESWT